MSATASPTKPMGPSYGEALDGLDIPFIEEEIPERQPYHATSQSEPMPATSPLTPLIEDLALEATVTRAMSDTGPNPRKKYALKPRPTFQADLLMLHGKRKHKRDVMEDARKVLEQFLAAKQDAKIRAPMARFYQGVSEMETIQEANSMDYLPIPVQYTNSSSVTGEDAITKVQSPGDGSIDSYDGWSSHSPASKTPSLSSHSSSFKHRVNIVRPKDGETLEDMLANQKKKKKMHVRRSMHRRRSSTSSTSSSSPERRTPMTDEAPRKKKGLFKRARERIAQSFRRQRDQSPDHSDDERVNGGMKPKRSFSFSKRLGKSRVRDSAPELIGEIHSHTRIHAHKEINRNGSGNGTVLNINHGHQTVDSRFRDSSVKHRDTRYSLKESYPASDREGYIPKKKDEPGFFESLFRPFKSSSSSKSKRKNSKAKSKSADAIQHFGIDHLADPALIEAHSRRQNLVDGISKTNEFNEVIGRVANGGDGLPTSSGELKPDQRELRERLNLQGLRVFRPGLPSAYDSCDVELDVDDTARVIRTGSGHFQVETTHEETFDDVDGAFFGSNKPETLTDKPFHEKTDEEKDDIYEKIAEQLSAIADNYQIERGNPHSPITSDVEGATAVTPAGTPISQKLGAALRERGVNADQRGVAPNFSPVIMDLVKNASYNHFAQVIDQEVGREPSWQQLALVFQLTRSAVDIAGMGTAVAGQMKEMTLRYFEDRFANWIMGQGGWESAIDDTSDGLDSELD